MSLSDSGIWVILHLFCMELGVSQFYRELTGNSENIGIGLDDVRQYSHYYAIV